MRKKTCMKWTGGLQFVGHADSGHAVVTDAAKDNGGADSGPRPNELPLLGLAGCTGIDIIMILNKMKAPVEGLEISVEAEPVATHPKVWKEIWVRYTLVGNLDPKKVERAIKLSHEKYCSVGAILGATAALHFDYRILPGRKSD